MKKISLNKQKLSEKRLSLIKDKVSDLSDFESSKIVGGTSSYRSCVQVCLPTTWERGCPPPAFSAGQAGGCVTTRQGGCPF